ncbi:putative small subunit of serine palmitoyltransferase [Helianthus annuus]|nr:putative small subunit of serine palmitoyltransferase [Helianthus annuus]
MFPSMFNVMSMNWAQRKIYLYNVTFGLYMLDPWERYLFSILFNNFFS